MYRLLVVATLLLLGIPGFSFFLPTAFSQTAQQIETQTIQQGIAHRKPSEVDTTFLKRVLPVSFPASGNNLVVYTWRPNAFGKQLFFSVLGSGDNEYGCDLFVLDPIEANAYTVQILPLESMGDRTYPSAIFFNDVDEDGQKELLVLMECSLREEFKMNGRWLTGRKTHYQTIIFKYIGLSSTGRPQYAEDTTPRPYLDELATAAEVRQNLPRRKSSQRKPATRVPR